jgi:hypothetical protein
MYVGQFKDLFEEYKKLHNIDAKKMVFQMDEPEKEESLKDLR